ncbi:hypothetical protein TYRP_010841 [Tyrophagus putrescentiae]|nr:hypothetical protein TYRP_010841 [Tyrophagus putrescentiae]
MGNGDEEKEGEEEGEGGRQASFRRRLVSAFGGHTAEAMTAATQCPGGGECGQQQQQLIKTSDSCVNMPPILGTAACHENDQLDFWRCC